MTCYHPINAWIHKTRKSNTNKSIVVFGDPPGNLSDYRSIQVPCGQCIGCRLDYSRSWATRCMHEASLYEHNCFITLTYDDAHVPWSTSSGEMTLRKKDLQDFWKRLRKLPQFEGKKIRYYACGEYGELTHRPHYHAIVFGVDFNDKLFYKLSDAGFNYYLSADLAKTWKNGQVACADVSWDTCAYVARYCTKKLSGDVAKFVYDGIQKEFCVMSRRPGIGREWFEKYKGDVFPYDEIVLRESGRCRHLGVPRYYDNIFDLENPEQMEVIRQRRISKASLVEEANSVSGRMDQREDFKKLQTKCLERSL